MFDTQVPLAASVAAQFDACVKPVPEIATVTPDNAVVVERFFTVTASVAVLPAGVDGNAYVVIAAVPFSKLSRLLLPEAVSVPCEAVAPVLVVAPFTVIVAEVAAVEVAVYVTVKEQVPFAANVTVAAAVPQVFVPMT